MPVDRETAIERVKMVLSPELLEQLGERGRRALLAGTFLLSMCDGELHEAEFFWVNALAEVLGYGAGEAEAISGELSLDEIGSRLAELNLSVAGRNAVLSCFVLVSKADGELSDGEWKFVFGIGAALGRSEQDCRKLASRVVTPR